MTERGMPTGYRSGSVTDDATEPAGVTPRRLCYCPAPEGVPGPDDVGGSGDQSARDDGRDAVAGLRSENPMDEQERGKRRPCQRDEEYAAERGDFSQVRQNVHDNPQQMIVKNRANSSPGLKPLALAVDDPSIIGVPVAVGGYCRCHLPLYTYRRLGTTG